MPTDSISRRANDTIRFKLYISNFPDPLAVVEIEPYRCARLSDRALLEEIRESFETALEGRQHYRLTVEDGRSRGISRSWMPIDDHRDHRSPGLSIAVESLVQEWRRDPKAGRGGVRHE